MLNEEKFLTHLNSDDVVQCELLGKRLQNPISNFTVKRFVDFFFHYKQETKILSRSFFIFPYSCILIIT